MVKQHNNTSDEQSDTKYEAKGSSLYRQLLALSWPLVLTQLAQISLTATDTIMMGHLSVLSLAAGGLAMGLFNQIRTMAVGLLTGVGNHISHASGTMKRMGNTQSTEITSIVQSSFILATILGIFSGILLLGLGWLLPYLGQSEQISSTAVQFMMVLAPGYVPLLWFQVLRQFTVGMHKPKALLWITLVSFAINLGLNMVLGFGWGSWPGWGLAGIGVATSCVYVITCVMFFVVVIRDPELKLFFPVELPVINRAVLAKIIKHGLPIAGTYGSEAGIFSVAALMAGNFGTDALAAHTTANQITYLVFQISVGLSHGSSLIISRWVGMHKFSYIIPLAVRAMSISTVIIAGLAVLYILIPVPLVKIFMRNSPQSAIMLAASLLIFAAVQQFFDSAQNIGIGLLRGIGDTKSSFFISMISYWGVGLPVMLVCGYLCQWQVYGIWIGLSCGLGIAAIMLWRLFIYSAHKLTVNAEQ